MKLGQKVGLFLEQYRLSQHELARAARVPQSYLSRLGTAGQEENLRVDYAWRVAQYMGVPLDWLADPAADWPPPRTWPEPPPPDGMPDVPLEEVDPARARVLAVVEALGVPEAMDRLLLRGYMPMAAGRAGVDPAAAGADAGRD